MLNVYVFIVREAILAWGRANKWTKKQKYRIQLIPRGKGTIDAVE